MADSFNLERFVAAQAAVLEEVLRELDAGAKRSHWMWFVFPQIAGLGHSAMAQRYAIGSAAEAAAYLDHPVLGARLVDCTERVLRVEGRSAHRIFGSPDDLKFHSSMTLFATVRPEAPAFGAALVKYFGGRPDPATIDILGRS